MRCTRATYQLQLYLDRQLTLPETRSLEAHLSSCPDCRAEFTLLEEISSDLEMLKFVPEPANMHEQIMQKVALSAVRQLAQQHEKQTAPFSLFRPSLTEMLVAIVLATVATLALLLQQPSLRALLPIANGHDILSCFYMQMLHMLTGIDTNTLILALWVVGTILGVFITLALAGNEMRTQWFKAMIERLPVR